MRKVLGIILDVIRGYHIEYLDTNKKQITEFVGNPRDEFIKLNQSIVSIYVTIAPHCQIMD